MSKIFEILVQNNIIDRYNSDFDANFSKMKNKKAIHTLQIWKRTGNSKQRIKFELHKPIF